MEQQNVIFLSLGANLGNREETLQKAIAMLNEFVGETVAVSSFFYSKAEGFVSEHSFCNLCLKLTSPLDLKSLLSQTQAIEKKLGRDTKTNFGKHSDRTIDIDILFFNQLSYSDSEITVPHPMWNQRKFVYLPLIELVSKGL